MRKIIINRMERLSNPESEESKSSFEDHLNSVDNDNYMSITNIVYEFTMNSSLYLNLSF